MERQTIHGSEESISKTNNLPKIYILFQCNSFKNSSNFFVDIYKTIIKLWGKANKLIAKTILKNNEMLGISVPDFKMYYIATSTKTV